MRNPSEHPADMADMAQPPHQFVSNEYGTVYVCRNCNVATDKMDVSNVAMHEACPGPRTQR